MNAEKGRGFGANRPHPSGGTAAGGHTIQQDREQTNRRKTNNLVTCGGEVLIGFVVPKLGTNSLKLALWDQN